MLGVCRTLLARGCAFTFVYPADDGADNVKYTVAECEDELAFRDIEMLAGTMDLADTAALPPEERPADARRVNAPGPVRTEAASVAAANAALLRPGWLKLAAPGDSVVAVTACRDSRDVPGTSSDSFRAEYGFSLLFRSERTSGSEIVIAEVNV